MAEQENKIKKLIVNELGEDPLKINELPLKRVPDYMRGKGGIWFWTGAMITIAFLYQVVTGLILLLYYNPADAYNSTEYIINNVPYGALISATHLYGAYAMIVLIYIHMYRNYFHAAYKKPRQLQWILGVIMLALTLGVAFFGYSMPGDILAYDATNVGRGIAGSVPQLGNILVAIVFGNGTTTSLFQRMLGLHIILAGLIGLLFGLHFYLAESNNMMPGLREAGYKAPAVEKDDSNYRPWYPYNFAFMIQLSLFVIGLIILIPSVIALLPNVPTLFSPFPSVSPTSPLAAYVPPYPPWFLLMIYKAVDFFDFTGQYTYLNAYGPLIANTVFAGIPLLYFIIVPFIDRSKDLHPLSRPIITSFGILGIIYMAILSAWGALTPGVTIPATIVVTVLVPPFVVVVVGMLVLSKLYKEQKLTVTTEKLLGSFVVFTAILIFALVTFAQNISAFLYHTSALNLVSTVFTGGVTLFAAVGTMKSADKYTDLENSKPKKEKPAKKEPSMNPTTASIVSAVLVAISLTILYLVAQLNPITGAMTFGVGIGIDLIIAGIVLRIYRLTYYHE
ncbi:MAG: cytochrome bc complex cytochrome b subunit [Candidatus Thermoplasmatota archaeon]|nr:cytochrome bc complex cytochrome b subunit [Candidatus Thermoplasmatota archaeon]